MEYFNKTLKPSRKIEMLFFSQDFKEEGMLKYMAESNIPFPAVRFKDRAAAKEVSKLYDPDLDAVPKFILMSTTGDILYEGHEEPKKAIAKLLKKK